MSEKFLMFGDIEIEKKQKQKHHKTPILFRY